MLINSEKLVAKLANQKSLKTQYSQKNSAFPIVRKNNTSTFWKREKMIIVKNTNVSLVRIRVGQKCVYTGILVVPGSLNTKKSTHFGGKSTIFFCRKRSCFNNRRKWDHTESV